MLNPKNNRLDYGNILSPPLNYQLDFAIGTTYSLDLNALVGASISLGLSEENDSDLTKNPIFLLEALRSTGDKVALFCQSGQIHLPNKPNHLYILLEDIVFQVTRLNSPKAAFHPKFWLIRYINEDKDILYRVVVLSRNLTFSRSWDITFTMDGYKLDKKTNKNNPIINLIDYLCDFTTSGEKLNKMNDIKEELSFIHFDLNSNVFDDFEFYVNGIGDENNIRKSPLFEDNPLDDLLIMSPFLSEDCIKDFNNRKKRRSKAILISRVDALSALSNSNCNKFEFYVLKDEIIDGESLISEESHEIFKQDIHAKIFAVKSKNSTSLYLGSLNATKNALYNNVEFMIQLCVKNTRLTVKKLIKDIFNGDKEGPDSPFQLIEVNELKKLESEGTDLDLYIKKFLKFNPKANIVQNDAYYDIKLKLNEFKSSNFSNIIIKLKPLFSNKELELSGDMTFEKLNKIQLSEFFVISITDNKEKTIKRVIKIPTENIPEDRQDEVIQEVINDKTAFIRYVAFLLGDDYVASAIESGVGEDGSLSQSLNIQLPELYEKMLKSAIYVPEKFNELEFLIQTLSKDNVVPDGFKELYNTFKQVIDYE